jgi:hypothetical protein
VGRKNYSKGSQKALRRMRKKYGNKEGARIFNEKADEYGKGTTPVDKANSVYSKGSHRVRGKKK